MKNLFFKFILALAISFLSEFAFGQDNQTIDTTFIGEDYQTVVVEASSIIKKTDRTVYLPNKTAIDQASDGADLLSKLQIPTILVNKVDGSIKLMDNSKIVFLINGREVSWEQIKLIDPKNVKKIEYHDHPSMRFNGAKAVVDFIVNNPGQGGNAYLSGVQGLTVAGFNNFGANINTYKNKSQFNFNANFFNRNKLLVKRYNNENYLSPQNIAYTRKEDAKDGNLDVKHLSSGLSYSYTDSVQLFSFDMGLWKTLRPNNYYLGIITNSLDNSSVLEKDCSSSDDFGHWYNLYYHRKFKGEQMLMFNLSGNLSKNDGTREYQELSLDANTPLYNTINNVVTNSNYISLQANYEKMLKTSKISGGIKEDLDHSLADYTSYNTKYQTNTINTYIWGEFLKRIGEKADITLGLGFFESRIKLIDNQTYNQNMIQPKFRFNIKTGEIGNFSLSYTLFSNSPSINELNTVMQILDSYQSSVGNTDLKSYWGNTFKLEQSFNFKKFYLQVSSEFCKDFNPIMEEKHYAEDNSTIICSVKNQDNKMFWQNFINFRMQIIKNWLSVSSNFRYVRIWCNGDDFNHIYNNFSCNFSINVNHYGFDLDYTIRMPYNWFSGETLTGDEQYTMLSLGYKINKNFNVNIGVLNPLSNNYKIKSENRNKYAGYQRQMYTKIANNLAMINFRYTPRWGGVNKNNDFKRLNVTNGQSSNSGPAQK